MDGAFAELHPVWSTATHGVAALVRVDAVNHHATLSGLHR
jgi:hypothetical protein